MEPFIPQIKPENLEVQQENGSEPERTDIPVVENKGNEGLKQLKPEITNPDSKIKPKMSEKKKKVLIALAIVGLLALINICLFINLFIKAKSTLAEAKELKSLIASQDIPSIKSGVEDLRESALKLQKSYKLISFWKIVPFLGGYVKDGGMLIESAIIGLEVGDILVTSTEPYLDLLGFKGGSVSAEQSASDRIDFIVKAIPDLLPEFEIIEEKMNLIKADLDQINPKRYPIKFAGKEVRKNVETGLDSFNQVHNFISNGRPLLEQTPYLLGLDSPRTYLVLFQNDKELRPTGGFMTAYSIMKVDKAKFEPVDSSDIYSLDAKYKPTIEAPEPIIEYLKGPYVLNSNLRLRDMNWNPDFEESMSLFLSEASAVGIDEVDGIIAVDTQVLVYLLDVIGKIGVAGFGDFSNEIIEECNCPQVIYELESFADVEGPIVWDPAGTGKIIYAPPNSDNRKKIIGPLMNSIMSNALGQPKEKLPDLFEAVYKSMTEKHILFYIIDDNAQKAVEEFGIGGKIVGYEGDYLHINDANLGGRKSNLYVTQEVNQEIIVNDDGSAEKILTVTYKNPEKYDGWLNSVLPNWVRVYTPEGSTLISTEGFSQQADPYDENAKTVFAGYFELRPQGVQKIVIKYKLPGVLDDKYNLFIQKQPGTDSPLYSLTIKKYEEEFLLKTDKEIKLSI